MTSTARLVVGLAFATPEPCSLIRGEMRVRIEAEPPDFCKLHPRGALTPLGVPERRASPFEIARVLWERAR